MSYRKILVPIVGAEQDQATLETALALAKTFGARADVLFVRPNPVAAVPIGYLAGDLSGYSTGYIVEAAAKAADEAQRRAQGTFDKLIDKYHVSTAAKPTADALTASFAVVEGDFAQETERKSRLCDLVVFGGTSINAEAPGLREGYEQTLLSGARPVLFVPNRAGEIGQRIAIAYNGSAAAAHAVTAALPFLAKARELHAFEETAEKSAALDELKDYLALHGLSVKTHSLDPAAKTTGEALFNAAIGQKCDMIVLGGYGHSRLGEFVFGGVTRYVLSAGAPLAVLMAH